MVKKDDLGLLGKRRRDPIPEPPKPEMSFDGSQDSNKKVTPEINYTKLKKQRGTLRPNLEQKAQFDALLYVSPYEFAPELIADFIDDAVAKLSEDDKEEYQKELNKQLIKATNKLEKSK